MSLKEIIDNLKKQYFSDKIAHAYIFVGRDKVNMKEVAILFSKILNCLNLSEKCQPCESCLQCKNINNFIHPDFLIIDLNWQANFLERESHKQKKLSIETVKYIQERAFLKPVLGKKKVIIVDDAETLSTEAFNSFLKTLEEPPDNSVIILLTKTLDLIPKTVISRCQIIKFITIKETLKKETNEYFINLWEKMNSNDVPTYVLLDELESIPTINVEDLKSLISFFMEKVDDITDTETKYRIIDMLVKYEKSLIWNINPRLFLDTMVLRLKDELSSGKN